MYTHIKKLGLIAGCGRCDFLIVALATPLSAQEIGAPPQAFTREARDWSDSGSTESPVAIPKAKSCARKKFPASSFP